MKIVICHNNRNLVTRLLARPLASSHTVSLCLQPTALHACVAENEPHLVLLGGDNLAVRPKALEKALRELGFRTRILVVPNDLEDARLDAIWFTLQAFTRCYAPMEHDQQHYTVLGEIENGEIFDVSAPEPVWEPPAQEDRFLALLEAATREHLLSKAYLKAALATQRNFQRDWSLAVVRHNPLAYQWRTQLFRYVGALSHYVPGVESQCLPLPYPAARGMDLLPQALSDAGRYAHGAAQWFGLPSGVALALAKATETKVDMGNLAPVVGFLGGWTLFVREAAVAHCKIMDACLREDLALLRSLRATRHTRNQQRIFGVWWQLPEFMEPTDALQKLVGEFRQGRRSINCAHFGSFAEFLRLQDSAPQSERQAPAPFRNN
jgi:hypothetical protein